MTYNQSLLSNVIDKANTELYSTTHPSTFDLILNVKMFNAKLNQIRLAFENTS